MIASRLQNDRAIVGPDAAAPAGMNWSRIARFLPKAVLAATLSLFVMAPSSRPVSAEPSMKERLVGTWIFVSSINTRKDGSNYDRWGSNPKGVLMFDASGRYSQIIMRSESSVFGPKSVFSFGTFSVDEANSTLITEIEGGSLTKLQGLKQRRKIKLLTADELRYINLDGVSGALIDATWKRAPARQPQSASLLPQN